MSKQCSLRGVSVTRRDFVHGVGILSLATAVGNCLAGCSNIWINIPCLGPAAPPAAEPGVTLIRASEIGCALDCDLRTGKNKHHGGAATDDGPRLNAALAVASQTNPITLIIDGSALVSGLFPPAGGHWSIAGLGCGTGFFIKSGTNNDGIHNGDPSWFVDDAGPPAPARGKSVSLRNFVVNGNAGDGRSGDSTTGYPQGNLKTGQECYPINLMNIDDVVIENVVIVNSPCYHIRLSNVGNVTISGCVIESTGPNTDGIHIGGPANDISIANCSFLTGDDAIALNCPEGYSGDIARVSVSSCTFTSPTFMRLDTIASANASARFYIHDVSVTNCTGTSQNPCFDFGDGAGSNQAAVAALTVSGCTFNAPACLNLWANFGVITLRNCTLIPSNSSLEAPGYAFVRTDLKLLNPDSGIYAGSAIVFQNCTIVRKSGGAVSALILENNSSLSKLEFDGFTVQNANGSSDKTPGLIQVMGGSIGELTFNGVDSADIAAPISGSGFSAVGVVDGAGVLQTGWEFPDAVMANNVPYFSATTGEASIKIGGVVEPYP